MWLSSVHRQYSSIWVTLGVFRKTAEVWKVLCLFSQAASYIIKLGDLLLLVVKWMRWSRFVSERRTQNVRYMSHDTIYLSISLNGHCMYGLTILDGPWRSRAAEGCHCTPLVEFYWYTSNYNYKLHQFILFGHKKNLNIHTPHKFLQR